MLRSFMQEMPSAANLFAGQASHELYVQTLPNENAVRIREPISKIGLDSHMGRPTFSRFACREKTHGRLSSWSVTIKSSASPGLRCLKSTRLISTVTLGCE